jgi:drug/metabolite transporter (DMT)-like permease
VFGIISVSGIALSLVSGFSQVSFGSFQHFLPLFVAAGLCFGITNMLSFAVLQYVDAAIGTLLMTFNIISSVILATLVINEGLSVRQLVGGFVVVLSVYCVLSLRINGYRHKRLWLGVLLSIIASLFFGIAMTSEKYLLNHVSLQTYLTFGWSFQFIGTLTIALCFGKLLQADLSLLKRTRFWRWALLAGVLRVTGGILFVISLKLSNNLSLVSVFTGFRVLLAAIFAAYLLGEREYLARKYEAALLAVGGIAIMLWK